MTDNLMARLKFCAEFATDYGDQIEEAINRIEKLEAALSHIIVLSDDYDKAVPIARKALEKKDD